MRSFIFIFFTIVMLPLYGQTKLPINDPANPDCPCHKIQKQAEKEFATHATGIHEPNERKLLIRLKKNKKWQARLFRMQHKYRRIKKERTDYSVCYKW